MKKLWLLLSLVILAGSPASANPWLLYPAAVYGAQAGSTYGPPLLGLFGYGLCHTPSIHIFGTDQATVGLDWSSYISSSKNVYGVQMSLCGGGFSEDLYGLETSLLACGWVTGYDTGRCRMNGIEIAPIAVKTAIANGFQLCPIYSKAGIVNGLQVGGVYADTGLIRGIQCGIVNTAIRADGIQLGLFNSAREGCCLQVGLWNLVHRRRMPVFPVVNFSFR